MSLPVHRVAQDETPVYYVPVACPVCGLGVRVPIVHEFVRIFRQVCTVIQAPFSEEQPMFADRCPRGHVVTVPYKRVMDGGLGLARTARSP